ncbi:MAG: hypothetical protein JHC84_04950 [Solirubrobacteraceae bacterium]|nr:hypothetical protein [Solirubrobacteraceae bacterium]
MSSTPPSRPDTGGQAAPRLVGAAALIMALCCALLPAGAGALAGATLAGPLGVGAAVVVALAVAAVAVLVLRRRGSSC